jgi:hypothetical protein
MFWGLEALRIIEDRLSSSLLQVRKAREAMDRNVKLVTCNPCLVFYLHGFSLLSYHQEAGEQHIDLLLEYDEVTERFEKRYGMLSAMQNKTQLRIRRVMGLREGVSLQILTSICAGAAAVLTQCLLHYSAVDCYEY